MWVSYQWLKRYAQIEESPECLAERLTFLGLNVEQVTPVLEHDLDGVVMARILEVERIEDELMACLVDAGGAGRLRVVSGAPNTRPGIHSPLALPGTRLPDGEVIETRSLRGVRSEGMLCSARELGLELGSPDYLLEVGEATPGSPARTALGLDDSVFDLDLTPNYGVHCQSVLGVVREIAAALQCPVTSPPEDVSVADDAPEIGDLVSIRVVDTDLCPRYTATLATRVEVAPSPWSIQRDLIAAGIRPINNIVDVTNHVMLEYGQPLHAFDLDLVQGGEVIVRRARPGERIITLDGDERVLNGDDLVIADRIRAIGIAGVMGGRNSEITESTRSVLLESAYFEPRSILRTSRRLGLRTEASLRFEKGRDPEGTVGPTRRALRLIADMGAGSPAAGVVDAYPERVPRRIISFRPEQVNRLLGTDL
ncbi:MAG: phenylalanine--tRNA ligase subunit beta, partial [Bacillota bacterium]